MSALKRNRTTRRLAAAGLAAMLAVGGVACAGDDEEPPADPMDREVEQDDMLPPSNVPSGGEGLDEVD